MPDGPFPTPDEERVLRMVARAGSPEGAADSLIARLQALEEAVAALEAAALAPTAEGDTEIGAVESSATPSAP